GGMGSVWVAHNTALDVDVAVKLMRRDRATPEAAARFTTEARAAARLGHSSIVRVFDFGETTRGDPFIVMELLHGESLGALLQRKKKLAPTIAVQTLLPVAHALAAAHAKGIVHRDLKPDNILLAKDETGVVTPKVVDFGIAKLVSADADRHFTIAGEVLGSPDYMSPEQARGEEDIDHRSDIWTFTVLLYEAIVGRRPFDGPNYNALLASIIASRPTPITELGVNDPALWSILEKGLSKERDGRWQSVREMGMELARWALDHGAETDLVGTSLAAQWLEPTRKRLFTVAGSQPTGASDSGAAAIPAIPKPPPLGGLAAEVPSPPAPATSNTMPPFARRRRAWMLLPVVVLLALAAYGVVQSGALEGSQVSPASDPTAPATASASGAPTDTPTATASEAPATTGTAAKPATSAKGRPTATPTTTVKPRAPQVKGNIKF
ncbi:MAG: protein kinase, partial [Polyangiaceae bacterium]